MSGRLRQIIFVVLAVLVVGGMLLGTVLPALAPMSSGSARSTNPASLAQAKERINELRVALAQEPENSAWLIELGNLCFATEDYSQAADAYNRALELDQRNTEVRTDLGTVYLLQGMMSSSVAEYRKVLEIDPNNVQAHYYLGVALANGNPPDVEGALASWRTVVTLDPNGPIGQSAQEYIRTYEKDQ